EDHAGVPKVEPQRLDDLAVAEVKHLGTTVDHSYLRAEGGEHRGELDPDHTRADHHQRPRDALEAQDDAVRVEDGRAVDLDARGRARVRPGGDDDPLAAHPPLAAAAVEDGNRVRVDERRLAVEERDVVPEQLGSDDVALSLAHLPGPYGEVGDVDLLLHAVVLAVDPALREAGQVQDGLADRLRRDRSGVDGHASEMPVPLDERRATAELRGLDRGLLPGWARTDDEQLEVEVHDVAQFAKRGCAARRYPVANERPASIRSGAVGWLNDAR